MQNGHVMEVASLKEGEWSCYKDSQLNGRENDHVMTGGQFNGGRMVMLQRWPV